FQDVRLQQFESAPKQISLDQSPQAPQIGDSLGEISIPSLGLSAIVVEGDGDEQLRYAVGHIPGTAYADNSGNIGLAGHRDTFFRGLGNVRDGDTIVLQTA